MDGAPEKWKQISRRGGAKEEEEGEVVGVERSMMFFESWCFSGEWFVVDVLVKKICRGFLFVLLL